MSNQSKKSTVRFVPSLTRPSIEQFEREVPTSEPCAWEEQDGPFHYQTSCEPVPGHPDLQDCKVIKVKNPVSRLVPSNCTQREYRVRRGVQVVRTVDENGNARVVS